MIGTIQILALALIAAVVYPLLKKESPSIAQVFALSIAVCFLGILCSNIATTFAWFQSLQNRTGTEAFSCLLKAAGIILCADYGRDLCKDAGSDSMANCISIAGRFLVLAAAAPLLENVYQTIVQLS